MALKTKKIKIKNKNNSFEEIKIGANAEDIDMENGNNLQNTLGNIDIVNNGNVSQQLFDIQNALEWTES